MLKQIFGDKLVEIKQVLENAIFTIPVGEAQQDAVIAAVAVLGKRHEMLREVSVQALESLAKFKKEIAGKYLNEMKG